MCSFDQHAAPSSDARRCSSHHDRERAGVPTTSKPARYLTRHGDELPQYKDTRRLSYHLVQWTARRLGCEPVHACPIQVVTPTPPWPTTTTEPLDGSASITPKYCVSQWMSGDTKGIPSHLVRHLIWYITCYMDFSCTTPPLILLATTKLIDEGRFKFYCSSASFFWVMWKL